MFFSILPVVLAASGAMVSAQNSLPLPQFTAILTGQFNATKTRTETGGPFGTRVHFEESGGDLVNVTTGEVVANLLSFADNGVSSSSGLNFPSATMPLTWSADGHFASVFLNGVESQSSHTVWTYAHVETDSPTYSWMNGKFFLVQVDLSSLPVLSLAMYEETTSGAPASSRKRNW